NKKIQLSSDTSIWHKVIQRYTDSDLVTVIGQIQEDFSDFNLLNVNKSDLLEENPVLLNTLEEIDNPVRAVFAVAKVNEGWDVLNLYDIVRISEQASSSKKFSQLIAALTPEIIRRHLVNKKIQLSSDTSIWHKVIQRYTDSDLVTVIGQIQEDFSDFNLL
ncbi:hypothetical protein MAX96_23905, partial [Escherichia coli]